MYFYIVVWNSVILSGRCLLSIKIWIYPESGFLHFLHYTHKWKKDKTKTKTKKKRKEIIKTKKNFLISGEVICWWYLWYEKKDESVCNSCYSPILWVHVIWSKQLFIVICLVFLCFVHPIFRFWSLLATKLQIYKNIT